MINLNNPKTVKIITATIISIVALVLLSAIMTCLWKCFKTNSKTYQDKHKHGRSDEEDILLIFGKSDQSINSGKSNHENLKKKINEVEQSVENFYILHLQESFVKNGVIINSEEQKLKSYSLKNDKTIIENFKKTQFETDHDFIQYFFPSKSQSKFSPSAPYVQNPEIIKTLIQNSSISINDIDAKFKNFSSALKFYLQTTGICYKMPESTNASLAQKESIISDNISTKIKNELLNGSKIQHNQLRITRILESMDLHLSFLKFAKEAFIENNDQENLKQINIIELNFNTEINEYILEIFQYISELSQSKNSEKKESAKFQASALLDLLIHIDENFKNKKEKLNEVEKQLLHNINDIRKNFKTNLFDNLTKNFQNEIETNMNSFISQEIKINSSNMIISYLKRKINLISIFIILHFLN